MNIKPALFCFVATVLTLASNLQADSSLETLKNTESLKTPKNNNTLKTEERHPPMYYVLKVVGGLDGAEGLAEADVEKGWQVDSLSNDPLRVKTKLLKRYDPAQNEERKCARVEGAIGQDKVPLKDRTYKDCATDTNGSACREFYVYVEMDICEDGQPPTKNLAENAKSPTDPNYKPPITVRQNGK
jgi:hypothetical protein